MSNAEGEVHGTAQHGTDRAQTRKATDPNPRVTEAREKRKKETEKGGKGKRRRGNHFQTQFA